MKKYTILGHVFELDNHAHAFLSRYIERIEHIAHQQHISRDVLEDLYYSIIEKLYRYNTPISEAQVMQMSQAIGEPEDIFETQESDTIVAPTNIFEKWFGKPKPMLWGVCYWIATSLNISVTIVRLVMIVATFVYGTSIWLYPLLALFVPYQDKKSSSGSIGGFLFEIIRIVFWLGVIFLLGSLVLAALAGAIGIAFVPPLSNQSIIDLIPSNLYPIVGLIGISLIILFIGSIGALFKKVRVTKVRALIATTVTIAGTIIAAAIIYHTSMNILQQDRTILTQHLTGSVLDASDTVTITLTKAGSSTIEELWEIEEEFQSVKILPVSGNMITATITTSLIPGDPTQSERIISSVSQLEITGSANSTTLVLPKYLFTQKVPFSFIHREITIFVPQNKTINRVNNSPLDLDTPYYWMETTDQEGITISHSCEDQNTLRYDSASEGFRCAHTRSFREDRSDWEDNVPDAPDVPRIDDDYDQIQQAVVESTRGRNNQQD